jgi:hypothetical protein
MESKEPDIFRLATITDDTKINIVENDLASFSSESPVSWEYALNTWLEHVKEINVYFQSIHYASEDALKRLDAKHSSLNFFDYSSCPELSKDHKSYHIILFDKPAQLWREGTHNPGQVQAYNSLYMWKCGHEKLYKTALNQIQRLKETSQKVSLDSLVTV